MRTTSFKTSSNPFLSSLHPSPGSHALVDGAYLLGDRYKIRCLLGDGGYSLVYQASDALRHLDVALKVARAASCDAHTARAILEREFCMNARVGGDRNVVQVYDLHYIPGHSQGLLVMAMELVKGGSLAHWLQTYKGRRDLRLSQGRHLMVQACQGLIALHHAGVVHLDLKPQNMMITRDGVLKISDLGAAQCLHSFHLASGGEYQALRHGTPAYMSPEQFTARHPREISLASDIYSLGCIMYEMFSADCHPPFAGTYQDLCEQHHRSLPPPINDINPQLAEIVYRCLAKSVSRRSSAQFVHQYATDAGPNQRHEQPRSQEFSFVS